MQFVRDFYRSLTLKPQGFTMIVAGFLPVFAIIAMFPVVAAIIQHFKDVPDAAIKVPAMVTAPGYAIAVLAPFAGLFVDRFGRRQLLLICTFFYGIVGSAPFLLEDLNAIIATRVLLGVCEAGILTIVNTLIADYWDDSGRRNWLMLQGLVGPAFQPLVFILVAAVAAIRWNGGFLVYLVAAPIFVAMYLYMFEPERPAAPAAVRSAGASDESRFPLAAAMQVGGLTLLASIIYYVFIVNGSIAWGEIGLRDPMAVSKATLISQLLHPGRLGAVPGRLALFECGADRGLHGPVRARPGRHRPGPFGPGDAAGADHPADRRGDDRARTDRLVAVQVLVRPSGPRHGRVDQRLLPGPSDLADHHRHGGRRSGIDAGRVPRRRAGCPGHGARRHGRGADGPAAAADRSGLSGARSARQNFRGLRGRGVWQVGQGAAMRVGTVLVPPF